MDRGSDGDAVPRRSTSGKTVLNVGRWRIAFLYSSPTYRLGFRRKPHGFDVSLRYVVVSVMRRMRRA